MRKIKEWGKIKLWETSCCGIPMYPKAHKSYSLIKALTETASPEQSDELNKKENQMTEEKTDEEKPEAETPEEPKAEAEEKPEEKAEAKPEEPIVNSADKMTGILTKAIVQAIKEAGADNRGLVSNEQKVEMMQESLKKKSLGELAMMNGLFTETVGNPVGAQ